jgi:hypothetical protein
VVTLADLLRPDRPVDLPLVMLAGPAEYRQEHGRAVGLHQYVTLTATW